MAATYVKKKCEICLKTVTQYLTITPGDKPLKFGKRGIPVRGPTIVCKTDLRLLRVE